MTAYRRKGAQVMGDDKQALRQTGQFEWHPDECECRKCRRARAAWAHREKPRYGERNRRRLPKPGRAS